MTKTTNEMAELQSRAEAAEGLLATLIFAVEKASIADDAACDPSPEYQEESIRMREEAHEALAKTLSLCKSPTRVENWVENLHRIDERESNMEWICKRSERTRDLLESTRIELELVSKRLVDRLRRRADSEKNTADHLRNLEDQKKLPQSKEVYRLRDRHEYAVFLLNEEANFTITLIEDTLARAKADTLVERARLRIQHFKELATSAHRIHMRVLAVDKPEIMSRTDTLLMLLNRFIDEEAGQ